MRHQGRVIVDERERACGIPEVLRNIAGLSVTVRTLSVGDYAWDGRLLFERKALGDLVESIKDGRLLRQACRLASARERAVLILEGVGPVPGKMRREAIQGALITVTVLLGIPLLRSRNAEETARLMLYAARQIRTVRVRRGHWSPSGRRFSSKKRAQLRILQALPGVGPFRAESLLSALGSVEGVINATAEELEVARGIGEISAKAIRWVVS